MKAYTAEDREALIEWLTPQIHELETACDEIPFGLDEDDAMQLQIMRIALASLEAVPLVILDDEDGNPEGFIAWYERHFALQPYKGSSHVSDCEEAWRASLRLNATAPAEEKR